MGKYISKLQIREFRLLNLPTIKSPIIRREVCVVNSMIKKQRTPDPIFDGIPAKSPQDKNKKRR
jgi:hypothetical protein